ncbi:type II CAAX endopeptidase family protein [Actinoplanes sp. NEAU-A12]|uniref:Type II CAAX endopeptidase family protein n=1 Tax=Actinoplanes sandaracinus TaxID=3045177 RepID=A0ABT6X0U8_9ACTN|nr:type II CAAX endopeptidase family protein [Actinoplanes sandaracinus]MDI6105603.1 type II CAAX endopeptidase family protein [Actinoplanes sandaracinus]
MTNEINIGGPVPRPSDRAGFPPVLGDHRVLHSGRWRPLRALGWMVGLIFVVAMAFGVWSDAVGSLFASSDAGQFAVRAAGALLVLAVYAVAVRLGENRAASEIAPRPALTGVAIGLAIGVLLMVVVMAILAGTGLYDVTFLGAAPAWHAAGLAIQAGVFEELLVRAVLFRLVWRAFGPWVALAVSAVAFGAGHLANPEASVVATLCIAVEAGIMLAAFYALTGRIWVSIGVHIAWNFTQGYLFGAAVSGSTFDDPIARSVARPDAPEWLTGGAFGPEASLPALLVCMVVGVAALVMAWKRGRFRAEPKPASPTT